jgi:NADH-quinone oxidoreductase subunit G
MINIEIDGIPLEVESTKMIIQAADEAGIDIPRFCYHKKLSIAANCRMCLVEVESARTALPACATPVTEGMKVFTKSKVARDAQRGVMEFLLINHPLDCPICDQGGECELQDLSMGYGDGVSRFTESKRVVKDKEIGSLIKTDMTRCIHCTRCVRFGEEVAGIKELGATGRGEHMEIGTYIEHSLVSELSGNVIDLCPVGALTSKPFRYKARAWELNAHPSVAPHDAVGSNIEFHTRRGEVLRVVPRENEAINETWISDRDRFSYLGLNHEQRATEPMVKENGQWQKASWQAALEKTVAGLTDIIERHGSEQIAGLIAPTATLEEAYLFQKLLRGLGSENIDHRLRQQDFSDKPTDYLADWSLSDIADSQSILLIGCHIRAEQPILAHRIRQAALNGSLVSEINYFTSDLLMPVDKQIAVDNEQMLAHLAGIAKALLVLAEQVDDKWVDLLATVEASAVEQTLAMQLANADTATLFVGALANRHPKAATIRSLAALIAELTNSHLVVLPDANSTAALLAGALPNNGSEASSVEGLNAQQVWQQSLRSYVLFNLEPELDCDNPAMVQEALHQASFNVVFNNFVTDAMLEYADVVLPVASFAESSGTFIGVDQQWQNYNGAVEAKGESRPGWKILRVLANLAEVEGFDYISSQDVSDEVKNQLNKRKKVKNSRYIPESLTVSDGLMAVSEVAAYQCDSIVRRSHALMATPENKRSQSMRMNSREVGARGLIGAESATVQLADYSLTLPLVIDDRMADNCVYLPLATIEVGHFGPAFSEVTITAMREDS